MMPPPSVAEMLDRLAAEMPGRDQVDLQRAMPGAAPGLELVIHIRRLIDARIVDQHIDLAAPGQRLPPDLQHAAILRQIPGDKMAAIGAQFLLHVGCAARGLDVVQHGGPARLHDLAHDGGADAPAAAGDEGDLAREIDHLMIPCFLWFFHAVARRPVEGIERVEVAAFPAGHVVVERDTLGQPDDVAGLALDTRPDRCARSCCLHG